MKYLSLFSGIGGFELGIEHAFAKQKQKAVCVGFSEIDKYAAHVYAHHFPTHKNFGDITKIKANSLPDFDLLVGGFPCQSFSIAGKRKGFEDPRGQMFFHIARILRAKRPRRFLLENVAGILSHNEGATFRKIICEIEKLGYSVEWHVLNSADYLPQHRTRVFIVGHLGKKRAGKVFPLERTVAKAHGTHQPKTRSGIVTLYDGGFVDRKIISPQGISPAIVATPKSIPNVAVSNSSNREFGWRTNYCPALTASDSKSMKIVRIGCRIRKLLPVECARLQGFPDSWCDGLSDSQAYRCYGNAVTTNVVSAIVSKMYAR
ncbi:MAG TPA: DNA (cytosine-5-)-methyltransferase [Bacteroidia bacterium]|nr:DNA (cytosine-5-)-methyltransferase [Bacteroidia bacterium]